jgi:predicted 3-demethylubiquinone-9 3-methyltransferase (glyoxalase superfamily)
MESMYFCQTVNHNGDAENAARFYAQTFPDSFVGAVHRAPGDYPAGKKGDVLTVEFTVMGVACLGLNGGPAVKHNGAFSFQVATADQMETDRYWDAIVGNGGHESVQVDDADEKDRHRQD